MPRILLSMPVDLWPDVDRRLWRLACEPAEFLAVRNPARGWSAARRDIVAEAYGQWLGFLAANGELDPESKPGDRMTDERLKRFVDQLLARVSPMSAAMMVGAIKRMLDALEPGRDPGLLAVLYRNLKQSARPSRDKLGRMVSARALFKLGFDLMDSSGEGTHGMYKATRYRDGLMIALLISCPVRIRNLMMIEVGRHLTFDGRRHLLRFETDETKTGRPHDVELPRELSPRIERYLEVHRPTLLAASRRADPARAERETALWISRWGIALEDKGARAQIKLRTAAAFGAHVWPHLFRDCAVTELVDSAPAEIGIAPDLLGHGSLRTTQKHYIKAAGMTAHRAVQEKLAAARKAARKRERM